MKTLSPTKRLQYAVNANRLLLRTDARSTRRLKYWLRQYGVRDFTPAQLRRPQAPFDLVCLACGLDINQWKDDSEYPKDS